MWQSTVIADSEGFYEEPYAFYLEQGNQTLSLTALREPMAIDYIELFQDRTVQSYAEAKQQYETKGLQPVKSHISRSRPKRHPLNPRLPYTRYPTAPARQWFLMQSQI